MSSNDDRKGWLHHNLGLKYKTVISENELIANKSIFFFQ